jgi:hypothetical protein
MTQLKKVMIFMVLFTISIAFSSCRKDKFELEGDYALLTGKWKWYKSTVLCDPKTGLTCDEKATYDYEIEFLRKGEYIISRNSIEEEKGEVYPRGDVIYYDTIKQTLFTLTLSENRKSKKDVAVYMYQSQDTINFTYHPWLENNLVNLFIRE